MPGSSPLARGLPNTTTANLSSGRIIPARAGFTRFLLRLMGMCPDHPRSRGVYRTIRSRCARIPGSSPLARGLRREAPNRNRHSRIIPARAGFTRSTPSSPTPALDHPRSRGVYQAQRTGSAPQAGSSPLARGLLVLTRVNRAQNSDHPRSRGVYLRVGSGTGPPPGSSPLARGLLAGGALVSMGCPDHPRSRGVYDGLRVALNSASGSSPLARGLRGSTTWSMRPARIIPARAGFTPTTCPTTWASSDHPRSRGVYDVMTASGRPVAGSSPLARGLPVQDVGLGGKSGIIPARAGFTEERVRQRLLHGDHPRSRGVYDTWTGSVPDGGGSSPLARGLHHLHERLRRQGGIIPARAGFT